MSDLQEVPELSWKQKPLLERFRAGEGSALSVSHHSVCGGSGVGGQPFQEPWSESWPYTFLAEYSWVHLFISSSLCSFLEKQEEDSVHGAAERLRGGDAAGRLGKSKGLRMSQL